MLLMKHTNWVAEIQPFVQFKVNIETEICVTVTVELKIKIRSWQPYVAKFNWSSEQNFLRIEQNEYEIQHI